MEIVTHDLLFGLAPHEYMLGWYHIEVKSNAKESKQIVPYAQSDKGLFACMCFFCRQYLSRNMRFPTMWYVRSASLRSLIRAFASHLNNRTLFGVS